MNQPNQQQNQPSPRPWYKEPWVWGIMAGPAIVVVAGFITLGYALHVKDSLVTDDYYKEGKNRTSLSPNTDKNKIGEQVQTELAGAPVKGELFEFAPAIDDYLKEHLFGDIFSRGVLTNQEREISWEIITIIILHQYFLYVIF